MFAFKKRALQNNLEKFRKDVDPQDGTEEPPPPLVSAQMRRGEDDPAAAAALAAAVGNRDKWQMRSDASGNVTLNGSLWRDFLETIKQMQELGTLTCSLTEENKCLKGTKQHLEDKVAYLENNVTYLENRIAYFENRITYLEGENYSLNAENDAHAGVICDLKYQRNELECQQRELKRELAEFEHARESAAGCMQSVREKLNKQARVRCMLQGLWCKLDIQDVFYQWRGNWRSYPYGSMCHSHSPQKLELQGAFEQWRSNWRSYLYGSVCYSRMMHPVRMPNPVHTSGTVYTVSTAVYAAVVHGQKNAMFCKAAYTHSGTSRSDAKDGSHSDAKDGSRSVSSILSVPFGACQRFIAGRFLIKQ